MKRLLPVVIAFAFLCTVAGPLHAQTGCVTSPENPTIVLGLVGSAGAFVASVRARHRARRSASSK